MPSRVARYCAFKPRVQFRKVLYVLWSVHFCEKLFQLLPPPFDYCLFYFAAIMLTKKRRAGDPLTLEEEPQDTVVSKGELSIEDIDKQIELLTRMKISKLQGCSKAKRKSPSSAEESADSYEENHPQESNKLRRRFFVQDSPNDERELLSLYHERREQILALYGLGRWIIFGGRVGCQNPEVLGSGPSALAAYHSALPRIVKDVVFEVICVGKEEELVCKLPVRTVHMSYGTDILIS